MFSKAELTTFPFRSGKIMTSLLHLCSGGARPGDIFPLYFIETANYLTMKISTVFHKLVRTGGFSICWRVDDITPVSKSGSTNSCPSDYHPVTITFFLSKVFKQLFS